MEIYEVMVAKFEDGKDFGTCSHLFIDENNKTSTYKLNFNDGTDWLLFSSEECMKNYVIYHQLKDYTWEYVEVIANNLRFL